MFDNTHRPGAKLSAVVFGVEADTIRHSVFNMIASRDMIGLYDTPLGAEQLLDCKSPNLLDCHFTYTTMCEFLATCGGANYIYNPALIDVYACVCFRHPFSYCMDPTFRNQVLSSNLN